jgi:protein-S-isoprenylcysteine O-methyltransferase Ste14
MRYHHRTLIATLDASHFTPRNWPACGVGCIVAAYWWRVLRMAAKMRRKTGRAANFIPTEPLGKLLRILWQPIICLWIALPFYSAFRSGPAPLLRQLTTFAPLLWSGLVVAIIAYVVTRYCWKMMGKSWRMGIDPGEKTTLVVTGPYAFVRHPIYGLSTILMAATVAATPTPAMIVVAVIHAILLQWEARREEAHLSKVQGAVYDSYRDNTGRFIPRIGKRFHSESVASLNPPV